MDMLCAIEAEESAPFGAWKLSLSPDELSHFGQSSEKIGEVSLLGIMDSNPSFDGKTLVFSLKDARLLNRGTSNEVIAVQLGKSPNLESLSQHSGELSTAELQLKSKAIGDDAFIQACKNELMPSTMINLARRLLDEIRSFSDDELREGLNRKWISQPNNFIAITIQNTKKNFAIHVRKTPQLDNLEKPKGPLDVRGDRPGYARFWITDEDTLDAAILAARASFELKATRPCGRIVPR